MRRQPRLSSTPEQTRLSPHSLLSLQLRSAALAQFLFPAAVQRRPQRSLQHLGAGLLTTVKPDHIGHADLFGIPRGSFNRVACRYVTFLGYREVNPGSPAEPEPFHHIRASKPDSKLVTRHSRLRHLQHRGTHP